MLNKRILLVILVVISIFTTVFLASVSCATASVPNSTPISVSTVFAHPTPTHTTPTQLLRLKRLDSLYDIVVGLNTKFEEIDRWIAQLEKAASLIPQETLRSITNGDYLDYLYVEFKLFGNWKTGTYSSSMNQITINTTPTPDHPFLFEYVSEKGYTDAEILYVWLHEMGHAWHNNATAYSSTLLPKKSPSIYGYYDPYTETIGNNLNNIESFAESFALYIFLPQYLKENFPAHYENLKQDVFEGWEYAGPPTTQVPSSIYARLSIPVK